MRRIFSSYKAALVCGALAVGLTGSACAEDTGTVAGDEASETSLDQSGKVLNKLYTIPEDGQSNATMSAASPLVRDLISARPNEDLIICVAGCRPGFDRVVFAAPAVTPAKVTPRPRAKVSSALRKRAKIAAATAPPAAAVGTWEPKIVKE